MTSPGDEAPRTVDICVIGAGPAGLAAAVAAAENGATVALVDAEPTVGGQFWRHPAPSDEPGAVQEGEVAAVHHQLRAFRRLRRRLAPALASGAATHLAGHEVWAVQRIAADPKTPPRFAVHTLVRGAAPRRATVEAWSVILATGAYDLQVPFPGWDLPGVMTAGGVQSLLKGHGVLAGRRVVVAGTGPFLLSVASGLVRSGATVPVVAEAASATAWARQPQGVLSAGSKVVEGAVYGMELFRHQVAYRTGWSVLRANGDTALTSVTIAPVTDDGGLDEGRSRTIPVDVLAVGWGFVPQLELAVALGCECAPAAHGIPVAIADENQRSSVPGVYLAGEICGVGGSSLAVIEGEIAGTAAAQQLRERHIEGAAAEHLAEHVLSRRRVHLGRRRASLRSFADAMAKVYPVPNLWLDRLPDDVVVCRCEEVTAGAIREVARRDGAGDARSAKLLARPGMGWCQGRICGYATECLAAATVGGPPRHRPPHRPIAAPIPLGALGRDPAPSPGDQ